MEKKKLTSCEDVIACFAILGKDDHVGMHDITVTAAELEKSYEGANFWLLYNPPFCNVLNTTIETEEDGLVWESFANVDGDERHWVHFLYEKWPEGRMWRQDHDSPDKPDEVLGKQWYAYRIADKNPYLTLKEVK